MPASEKHCTMQHHKHPWIELIAELIAFAGLSTAIILLWKSNLYLLLAVSGICGAVFARWHRRGDAVFFLVIAVFGAIAETLFVHFGVWRYANPTFLGVPAWFPVAFGTAGLIGARLVHTITQMWNRWAPSDRRSTGSIYHHGLVSRRVIQ